MRLWWYIVFILKEVGSSDSSGTNSTPNINVWVMKGTLVKFMRICSDRYRLLGLLSGHTNKNIPHCSLEGCSAGLDFQSILPKNDDKIVSFPVCSDHSKNAQFALYNGEDSGQNAGCTKHSCRTCVMLEHAYL
jgi:hypothetical protein